MLINLSNHPSSKWPKEQMEAAKKYGEIIDMPFPVIDPAGDEEYVKETADEYVQKVLDIACDKQVTVHLMGEMTLTYALLERFKEHGIPCIAATTERIVSEEKGVKVSIFRFVKFRYYV